MPIEIRELVIKATVTQDGGKEPSGEPNNNSVSSQEAIITICVEKVLSILKEKNER